jgi:hypothetical protein
MRPISRLMLSDGSKVAFGPGIFSAGQGMGKVDSPFIKAKKGTLPKVLRASWSN